jgi:uncharacterized protein with FMN-binding domain
MSEPGAAQRQDRTVHTSAPRSLRSGVAVVGIAGTLALAGCAGVGSASGGANSGSAGSSSGSYKDGTYTAEGQYVTPESIENISVTVTLKDNVITDVEINGTPQERESAQYQARFVGGISSVVVGKDIDQIDVSRVAGSSLTSGGFNRAIDAIKTQAAA